MAAHYIAEVRDRWASEAKKSSSTEREATIARLLKRCSLLEEKGAWTALASMERLLADVRGVRGGRRVEVHAEVTPKPRLPELNEEQALAALEMGPRLLADLLRSGEITPSHGLIRDVEDLAATLADAN